MGKNLVQAYMAKNYPGVTPGDANWSKGVQEFADGGKKAIVVEPKVKAIVVKPSGLGNLSQAIEDAKKRKKSFSSGLKGIWNAL